MAVNVGGQLVRLAELYPNANYTTSVSYDALGLLDRDTGADNGFLQLVRTEDADGYTVSATTAEGRTSTFRITSRSVNGGNMINFEYDNDSLLTSAGSEMLSYDPVNFVDPLGANAIAIELGKDGAAVGIATWARLRSDRRCNWGRY